MVATATITTKTRLSCSRCNNMVNHHRLMCRSPGALIVANRSRLSARAAFLLRLPIDGGPCNMCRPWEYRQGPPSQRR